MVLLSYYGIFLPLFERGSGPVYTFSNSDPSPRPSHAAPGGSEESGCDIKLCGARMKSHQRVSSSSPSVDQRNEAMSVRTARERLLSLRTKCALWKSVSQPVEPEVGAVRRRPKD